MRYLPILLLTLLSATRVHAELSIFACEPEWAALATRLAGEHAEVFSATTAQQDVHRIQARPALIAKLRGADLLVCTGADLEAGWLPLLLRRARNPRVMPGRPGYLEAARQVRMREIPERIDRADGDVHPMGNPHMHLDPRNIDRVAKVLAERLAVIDPAHATAYRQRYTEFHTNWRAAIRDWQRRAEPLRGARVVVHHRQWSYLLAWLGMEQAAALEPKPGIPPTPGHLAELKARLTADPARMTLRAPYTDPKPGDRLAEWTGIPVVVLPYTVGGTAEASDLNGLFETTLELLLDARR